MEAAARREGQPSRADVVNAMHGLSSDSRQGVVDAMQQKGGHIRGELVHQAARNDLSTLERDGFRTLAAATPTVRAQGIEEFLGHPLAGQPARRDAGSGGSTAPAAGQGALAARDPQVRSPQSTQKPQ